MGVNRCSFKFVVGCALGEVEKEVRNWMDARPCQQELYRKHVGNLKLKTQCQHSTPSMSTLLAKLMALCFLAHHHLH